ncbi:uncharacterized protein CYBJADRAFT_166351 [Cyberlindnera jadinii NRRL Y-1542]|uniref:Uncharacterized protein n=1 Tax=Cyberlindnera jadinii (strain ATCC 18201 / CBS 1600 / BCRC 20928 / JCM 3617 / NBRC 0987 / NRRL Y-1542) TaxID=983966 RepID=A0A1E4S829_CYBJN|nr:hypothetical protein CYBJADRAFT_166351 [Cyberlindnera jadinii NRRL Y-1542]ODV75640.1 hypothetical protein CYBJADRAFT_166351 [Cyberlindnera jadinii NRRL Y-1542]
MPHGVDFDGRGDEQLFPPFSGSFITFEPLVLCFVNVYTLLDISWRLTFRGTLISHTGVCTKERYAYYCCH